MSIHVKCPLLVLVLSPRQRIASSNQLRRQPQITGPALIGVARAWTPLTKANPTCLCFIFSLLVSTFISNEFPFIHITHGTHLH